MEDLSGRLNAFYGLVMYNISNFLLTLHVKSLVFSQKFIIYNSFITCLNLSKNILACFSWNIKAGRRRIVKSPQPPA